MYYFLERHPYSDTDKQQSTSFDTHHVIGL